MINTAAKPESEWEYKVEPLKIEGSPTVYRIHGPGICFHRTDIAEAFALKFGLEQAFEFGKKVGSGEWIACGEKFVFKVPDIGAKKPGESSWALAVSPDQADNKLEHGKKAKK